MKALTVAPATSGSLSLDEVAEPSRREDEVLVATHAIGVCGTDREIADGAYGEAPAGETRLILGHESIGRVVEAPPDSGLARGDWVAAMVRMPDPEPCASCARDEWDMCRNGRYTEHGIKGIHGFGRERFCVRADRLVRLDPALGELGVLLEPASVVAKAWEHVAVIASRSAVPLSRVLVTGAGPIGLLAALLAKQRGLAVTVLDRNTDGPKPALVEALGGRFVTDDVATEAQQADAIIECTGAPAVILPAIANAAPSATVCLTGVARKGRKTPVDIGALNTEIVLENHAIVGSVNANRRHYQAAATALAAAPRDWLAGLITARLPLARWADALTYESGQIKTIVVFDDSTSP